MQSNFDIAEMGIHDHFMDTNSCSPVLPIFNPQKQNHHQLQQHMHPQQQYHHHMSRRLVHPIPITHELFQRQHQFQALQQQEEQQEGRLQWQLSPVNFKLGLNENSGSGGGEGALGGDFLDGNGPQFVQNRPHNLGFRSWQTQDYDIRKEPLWKPLGTEISNTNKRQKQDNEGERGKDLENKYRLYGELEAIYSLGKVGEANQKQTGSGSALSGENENSTENVGVGSVPMPFSDPHDLNVGVGPTATVRVDNGSEASIGGDVSLRKIQKRKRKRKMKEQLSSTTRFFESLVKQVMDHQENLHNKYLGVIERMDKERREREAAWRCQEAENHNREAIAKLHEQALASSREALIVSYIEKITGQSVNLPPRKTPLLLQPDGLNEPLEELTPINVDHTNNRWPQSEVEALIWVRSSIKSKFQEPGVKGPLWEEVSAIMASMGYQRSAKRCKEKWENIDKYFRKTKDSAKKRPQPSKTCSYFNPLDQLYSTTPSTDPSSSSSYHSSKPSVAMDVGIQRQGYSELLEAFIDAGVTQNLSNGHFEISEMGSSKFGFDGIIDGNEEHVQGDNGEENHEDDKNMEEREDIDGDDSDE